MMAVLNNIPTIQYLGNKSMHVQQYHSMWLTLAIESIIEEQRSMM